MLYFSLRIDFLTVDPLSSPAAAPLAVYKRLTAAAHNAPPHSQVVS